MVERNLAWKFKGDKRKVKRVKVVRMCFGLTVTGIVSREVMRGKTTGIGVESS